MHHQIAAGLQLPSTVAAMVQRLMETSKLSGRVSALPTTTVSIARWRSRCTRVGLRLNSAATALPAHAANSAQPQASARAKRRG